MKIVGSGAKYTECIRGQLVLSNAEGVPFRYGIDFNLLFNRPDVAGAVLQSPL